MGNNIVEHTLNKVVFLDRDGTLNEEVNYLHKPEDMKLLPGVPQALKKLKDAGYKLIVVTNQAGVARGYYTEEDVKILHQYMNQLLEKEGAEIDAFYYCPHHPVHGIGAYKKVCNCRKPGTGMFEMAEKDFPVDRAASYMIGDKRIDAQAGKNFGVIKNSRKMVKNRRMSTMQLILNRQHNGYWKENKTWKKKFWQKEKIVYERT